MSLLTKWQQRVRLTRGGAHLPHRRYTAGMDTVQMPPPARLYFPMQQHIGAPCTPTVKVGDTVAVGQVIGDSDQYVSAPIHSSVSGVVTDITKMTLPSGAVTDVVVVDADGEQRIAPTVKPPVVHTFEDFIRAVKESGLVGLGGAGFPTHIKLNPKNRDAIDTVIINVAECEPYVTSDYREVLENSWDIVSGLQTVMEFLEVPRVLIAIERDRYKAVSEMQKIAQSVDTPDREVRVVRLRTRYPQGAEKVLIYTCTGRKMAAGQLPADVGCVVLNAASVAHIARYLKTGMPLVQKRITLDGSAIAHPKNIFVPVGALVRDVIAFAGGTRAPITRLLNGGPMMGGTLIDEDFPIMKASKAIVAFSEVDCPPVESGNCLRCGKCIQHCPMGLEPPLLVAAYKAGDVATLQKRQIDACMDCGCCTYSCPAHRPLAEHLRLAKALARRRR